jgi:formiminoglutamase
MHNNDPRLSDFIRSDNSAEEMSVQIIGFSSDEGVRINGGRPGASKAPPLIFDQLQRLTPSAQWHEKHVRLLSLTNGLYTIQCTGNVEQDQNRLGETVSDCLNRKKIPVIIGGGHETSYGHFLGYAMCDRKVDILNIDAHADVRRLKDGKAHSGSPFRQALEHASGCCKSYSVFGLNPSTVSVNHLSYVKKYGEASFESDLKAKGILRWLEKNEPENLMITMDMDAVSQCDAPGVSAPNASGISRELWLKLAFELGKQPNVTSFDLCEVNPEFDRDGQTVKLAALTIWNFLLGVALR